MRPSGAQWSIARSDHVATIVEVGGGLRKYRAGRLDVVAGYGEHEMCSSGRGQLLMPWPNRIRDGHYEFDGAAHQLPLSEPALGNASHGLVRWANWQLLDRRDAELTVGIRLHPQPGWPGMLDLTTRYVLVAGGLEVTMAAHNAGTVRVPFGCGAHPYVAIGTTPRAEVTLAIPGARRVVVDDERKLPIRAVPVDGEFDFRGPRPLADTHLDTAFGELERGTDGRWRAEVSFDAGRRPPVAVWGDESFGWVQAYTDKAADGSEPSSRGVALEPLTCPPDAFNSGIDLVVLEPGDRWSGSWGIEVTGA